MKPLLIAALPIALAGSLLVASPAAADSRTCAGTIGAISTDKDIVVPSGRTCRLIGTRIDGNVTVRGGATLIARGVRVNGNVQGEGHRWVDIRPRVVNNVTYRSRVNGSVQFKQGRGGELRRMIVNSDIQLFSNNDRFNVWRNYVGGNLQCKSNVPRPVGGQNNVQGNKEDQCRNL